MKGLVLKTLTVTGIAALLSINAFANDFSFTGREQQYRVSKSGRYFIEAYGGVGGGAEAHGGYMSGCVNLHAGQVLYINVGGSGQMQINGQTVAGGYNGGGSANNNCGQGGGATQIQLVQGELRDLQHDKNKILMVAGGSGGSPQTHNRIDIFSYSYDGCYGSGGALVGQFYQVQHDTTETYSANYVGMGEGGSQNLNGERTAGYKFGVGQSNYDTECVAEITKGYWRSYIDRLSGHGKGGAGGGGFVGGAKGEIVNAGGGGGSGYFNSAIYRQKSGYNAHQPDGQNNGYCRIVYDGDVLQTLTIDMAGGGYYNGSDQVTTVQKQLDQTVQLNIQSKPGYTFLGWTVTQLNDDKFRSNLNGQTYTFCEENINIRAEWQADLTIQQVFDKQMYNNRGGLKITFRQSDQQQKFYTVYQQNDRNNWRIIANDADQSSQYRSVYGYTGGRQQYTVQVNGYYKIDMYGARGGNGYSNYLTAGVTYGGLGGYSSGIIYLQKGQVLGVYVGGAGGDTDWNLGGNWEIGGGWNGGGRGRHWNNYTGYTHNSGGGGGATDIRLNGDQLWHRIMVAGGGGGGGGHEGNSNGGYGGGANSNGGSFIPFSIWDNPGAGGGTLTGGGSRPGNPQGEQYGYSGGFGYGGACADSFAGGGGGSGYYGGAGGCWHAGGGGSGYADTSKFQNITGANGCNNGNGYCVITYLGESIQGSHSMLVKAPDTNAPTIPSGGYTSEVQYKSSLVGWIEQQDIGTDYYHKCTQTSNGNNFKTSNIIYDQNKSGLRGYYYYIDDLSYGTAGTWCNFVEKPYIKIYPENYRQYLHVCAVDYAGNLSGTYTYKIDIQATLYIDPNKGSYMNKPGVQKQILIIGGKQLIEDAERIGYNFKGWRIQ